MTTITADQILADPAASRWLKDSLTNAITRDPMDAAADAAVLAQVLEARARQEVADWPATPYPFADPAQITTVYGRTDIENTQSRVAIIPADAGTAQRIAGAIGRTPHAARRPADTGLPPYPMKANTMTNIQRIIIDWCEAQNAATHAYKYQSGALATILAGFAMLWFTELGLLVACTAAVAWIVFAPRPIQVRTLPRHAPVPDSLLKLLADTADLSDTAKSLIGVELRKGGCITFETLCSIDRHLAAEADATDRAKGAGYQSMLAHCKPSTET